MDYKDYNDYELLNYIAENDEVATNIIYKKYEPLIYKISKKMLKYTKNTSIEINDLMQEGMLGLSKAIERFDQDSEASFYTYAKKCIERKILTFIVTSNRLKQRTLNESLSIDATYNSVNDVDYLFKSDVSNPESILISEEKRNELINQATKVLTDFELQVFELKIYGFDYKEIAEIVDKDYKAIDNALQRIRNKLKDKIVV